MDPPPLRYFELIRQMKNPFNYRLYLVDYARRHGLKAAGRAFRTTVPTVRQWRRRYQAAALSGGGTERFGRALPCSAPLPPQDSG